IRHRDICREASTVVVLDAGVEPSVCTEERHLDSLWSQTRTLEQMAHGCPRPLGRADGAMFPRLTLRARTKRRTAVPGALERHLQRPLRKLPDLRHGHLKGHPNATVDPDHPVRGRLHIRDIEVRQE